MGTLPTPGAGTLPAGIGETSAGGFPTLGRVTSSGGGLESVGGVEIGGVAVGDELHSEPPVAEQS